MERRHDEHVGRSGQSAKRVGRHEIRVKGHVGSHFPVIFEIDPTAVEDLYGFLYARRALPWWMAKSREREQREPWLITKLARHAGGFRCNFGDVGRFRHLRNGSISHQYSTPARQNE